MSRKGRKECLGLKRNISKFFHLLHLFLHIHCFFMVLLTRHVDFLIHDIMITWECTSVSKHGVKKLELVDRI